MGGQAGLGEETEGRGRDQGEEAAVAPEGGGGQGPRPCDRGRRERVGRIAVGLLAEGGPRMGEDLVGEQPHGHDHHGADGGRGGRKAGIADGEDPERRHQDAAEAGAVIGPGERRRPIADKPRRDDGVDGRRRPSSPTPCR